MENQRHTSSHMYRNMSLPSRVSSRAAGQLGPPLTSLTPITRPVSHCCSCHWHRCHCLRCSPRWGQENNRATALPTDCKHDGARGTGRVAGTKSRKMHSSLELSKVLFPGYANIHDLCFCWTPCWHHDPCCPQRPCYHWGPGWCSWSKLPLETMLMSTKSCRSHDPWYCYGQGSFFRSGIDDHKLITENESHWSPLWQPLTHSGKRNSPDKPLLKRILKIYATDAEMWFFTVDSLWRGERGCGKWRGKDSSFL